MRATRRIPGADCGHGPLLPNYHAPPVTGLPATLVSADVARLPSSRPSVRTPPMSPADPSPDDAIPDRLPQHTTPTWEVELLISGIAVFAMLQLPGWLNSRLLFLLPRFDDSLRASLVLVFSYITAASVILAATFALHLILRAYWIALVGMHSVYPGGIRWERLRMGPIEREVMQRRDRDFTTMIERADNRASIVFAAGVALAMTLLGLAVLIVGLFVAGVAIAATLRWSVSPGTILLALVAFVMAPMLLLHLLDRWLGPRLPKGGRLHRVLAAGHSLYARFGFSNNGGILGLLSSHHGRRRVKAIASTAVVLCILGVVAGQLAIRSPERLGSYAWFPHFEAPTANAMVAAHYDDQRDPLRDAPVPFVQSAVIADSYARLVVPYLPDHDIAAIHQTCPAAVTIAGADPRAAALLHCLTALHAVSLDGKPLRDLQYAAGSDPRTDRPALVAMIDVRALPPGHHVLRVERTASGKRVQGDASPEWIIPFWR